MTTRPPTGTDSQEVSTRLLLPGSAQTDLLEGAEATRLRELREAIRALFEAYETATAPPPDALATVNEAAAAGPLVTQLTWDDTGPRQTSYRTANGCPAAVAADAIALLAGPAAARLHACGAHGCIRWYLRSHGARQWCSTRCAARVRAAGYYARHQPGDSV